MSKENKSVIVLIYFFLSLVALGVVVGNNGAGIMVTILYGIFGTIWYIGTYLWG